MLCPLNDDALSFINIRTVLPVDSFSVTVRCHIPRHEVPLFKNGNAETMEEGMDGPGGDASSLNKLKLQLADWSPTFWINNMKTSVLPQNNPALAGNFISL